MNIADCYNSMSQAIQWYYDKQITIRKKANTYDDVTGMYSRTGSDTITVNCNVQSLDTKIDLDEHGKLINAEYKIFCDSNSFIDDTCVVTYKDKDYKVVKITDWDYYYVVYIRAVV